jgi:hypothetical protein
MHSDLKILDPIWTTAYIVRNHGYMIYDTLFAMDEKGEIKPQMVDKYDVSADKLTYTFTLRDGLKWHDGKPVTAEDCIASIKRWAAKRRARPEADDLRRAITAVDAKTFTDQAQGADRPRAASALGKPSSNVPFMMPKARRRDRPEHADLRTSPARARSSSSATSGSRATRRSTSSSRQVQAARRAGVGPGRRQGRQGRPRRMARDLRPAAGDQRAARRARSTTSRRRRTTCCRSLQGKNVKLVDWNPARQPVHLPLQPPAQAVRQSEGPPGALVRLQPEGLPRRRDRRSDLLQGLQGDVRLRHAARQRQGHGGPAGVELPEGQGAPEGGGLRRHAGRADAVDRPAGADQPRAGRQGADGERPASRSTCSRWTGRRWSRAAPRRTRRTRAAGTPS